MTSSLEMERAYSPILVLALHKFVTYLFTQTLTHLLTALGPTQGKWNSIYPCVSYICGAVAEGNDMLPDADSLQRECYGICKS